MDLSPLYQGNVCLFVRRKLR